VRARFSVEDLEKNERCLREDELSIIGLYTKRGATSWQIRTPVLVCVSMLLKSSLEI
jgi:hypothetical protein